jgi:hypothetical protein
MLDTVLFLDDPAVHTYVHLVLGLYVPPFIKEWKHRQHSLSCGILFDVVRDASQELLELFHFRPQFAHQPLLRNLQVCTIHSRRDCNAEHCFSLLSCYIWSAASLRFRESLGVIPFQRVPCTVPDARSSIRSVSYQSGPCVPDQGFYRHSNRFLVQRHLLRQKFIEPGPSDH